MSTRNASDDSTEALAPALKWAGGKRWLVPRLASLWRAGNGSKLRLYEPFCGALGVALGLRPRRALARDVNPHLVNFHRQVQAGLKIRIPMRNESTLYYEHRAAFNEIIAAGRAMTRRGASYFYYLNRTGFNGLCRFNRKGLFNVPFGRFKTINYRRSFDELSAAMRHWTVECGDFASYNARAADFVYADPPFDTDFHHYSAGGFNWDEQQRLAQWLARIDGPVVVSNSATPRILALYRHHDFRIEILDAPRSISRDGNREAAREMLATRNLAAPIPVSATI